jgi:osmotically-inducible protein OsmY
MRLSVLGAIAFAVVGNVATAVAADKPDSVAEDRVEARINQDARLKAQSVSVDVDHGVAVLKGKVASEADRARAERLAKGEGITRVDNRLEIDTSVAKDQIAHDADKAKQRIDDNAEKAKEKIDRNATRAKDRVENSADRGRGEPAPAGERVGAPVERKDSNTASEAISDTWITTKVKTQFSGADALKGSDLSVDTNKEGVVTLSGTAPSETARRRAVEIARTTRGVTKVVDDIKVRK